jgi:tetratricopeptide (TPR) repeat protein/cold shock CspA family protein
MNTAEHLQAAEKLAGEKRWAEAAGVLEGAGESTEVLERRCFYLSRAARYAEAIELLEGLRKRLPNSARIPYMVGYQFFQQEQYAAAITHYERAVELAPGYLKAQYRLAQAHARSGHKLPAQLAAMRVLRLWRAAEGEAKKRDARMYARACYLLAKFQLREEPEGSAALLREAVEHEPDDYNKHYLLGKALTRAGNPREALAALRRARQMEPRKTYVDIELVRALIASGSDADAKTRLREIAERCRAWDAYNAGRLAVQVEELDLARELFERANRRGPTRGNPLVKDQLRALGARSDSDARAPERSGPPAELSGSESPSGEVVYLNPRGHFGFLVDQKGVKRHFRIKVSSGLRKGNRVTFIPTEQEKGPAARDVQVAS